MLIDFAPSFQGFNLRPMSVNDVAQALDIVRAADRNATGESSVTLDEIAGDLSSSTVRETEGAVIAELSGQPVAFLMCFDEVADGRGMFFDLYVHPDCPMGHALDIAITLVTCAQNYALSVAHKLAFADVELKTAIYEADVASVAAMHELNLTHHRTFWRMRSQGNFDAPLNPAVTISTALESDFPELHQVASTAFLDYYDFTPLEYDVWIKRLSEGTHDANLWRIAKIDSTIVGYAMGSHRYTGENFGYITSLGVLKEYRNRGLAKMLLADQFALNSAKNMKATLLHTDSTNPTGATQLYEAAGMVRDQTYLAFKKTLKSSVEND